MNPATGLEEEVSMTTAVKTVNGVHYLLTTAEQDELDARDAAHTAGADDRQKEVLRMERKDLLVEADIQILKHEDAGTDASLWRAHRMHLRDITGQVDIYDIDWGTKPTLI